MEEKNLFKLEQVSVRLVKDAPLYLNLGLGSPEEVARELGHILSEMDREVMCVVNFTTDMKPINVHFASVGTLNATLAHPREIIKSSILSNAANILLLHCHPSGNLCPSKEDSAITDKMNQLCNMMGIPLVDHIIVGGDNRAYFSFKERGMMNFPSPKYETDYRHIELGKVAEGKVR